MSPVAVHRAVQLPVVEGMEGYGPNNFSPRERVCVITDRDRDHDTHALSSTPFSSSNHPYPPSKHPRTENCSLPAMEGCQSRPPNLPAINPPPPFTNSQEVRHGR
jgi:hypothetical protein